MDKSNDFLENKSPKPEPTKNGDIEIVEIIMESKYFF